MSDVFTITSGEQDVAAALEQNLPLPARDLESTAFQLGNGWELASYLDLDTALNRLGLGAVEDLFPDRPASARYVVLSMGGAPAVSALSAVDGGAGAQDQLRPVFAFTGTPEAIAAATDLQANVALALASETAFALPFASTYGFNCNWLREIGAGRFAGDLGIDASGNAAALVELLLKGDVRCLVHAEGGALRLRVFKNRNSGFQFATQISAKAALRTPGDHAPEELVAAILGIHPTQWLADLAESVRSGVPAYLEARLDIAAAVLEKFMAGWQALDGRLAATLWRAGGVESLRTWISEVASLQNRQEWQAKLAAALEHVPGWTDSDAAVWTEAAAGSLLSAVTEDEAFEKLVESARATDRFLSQEGIADALATLKAYAQAQLGLGRLESALGSIDDFERLDAWLRKRIQTLSGAIARPEDLPGVGAWLEAARKVALTARDKAAEALGKNYVTELSYRYRRTGAETALLDCSFDFSPGALEAYRRALAGDLSAALACDRRGVRLRQGMLTHGIERESRIELHLPFLDARQWEDRLEALATAEIECGADGRLVAYTVRSSDRVRQQNLRQSMLAISGGLTAAGASLGQPNFTITYTNERQSAAGAVAMPPDRLLAAYGFPLDAGPEITAAARSLPSTATLTLAVSGSLASGWLRAPGERDAEFFDVYRQVSVAVQAAMRRWLPYLYFRELDRYSSYAALPLVIYQATRPFSGEPRRTFTYDFMDCEDSPLDRPATLRGLKAEMRRIQAALAAGGRDSAADFYDPAMAGRALAHVARHPAVFNALLAADTFFVNSLVELGIRGNRFQQHALTDPLKAAKDLARFAEQFVAAFHRRLKHIYGGDDFQALGALILVEATAALNKAMSCDHAIAGVLRLRCGDVEQALVNEGFRR